jgi:hypothetical protein
VSSDLPVRRWLRAKPNVIFLVTSWLAATGSCLTHFALVPVWERDFINYWLAPRALWEGVNPYDVKAYSDLGLAYFSHAKIPHFNFTYPPHSLFLFAPFSLLPPSTAFVTWNAVSLGAFYLAARPLMPKGMPAFVAVLSPATIICFEFGQTGLVSSALFLFAARGSGLAAAALTFKPHVGFLAAPALLGKSRKAFLTGMLLAVAIIGLSTLTFDHWNDFLAHAFGHQGRLLVQGTQTIWYITGTTPMMGYGLTGLLIYGIVSAVVLSRNFNTFTAATATFLISPYGFHYDMSAVCLGFAVLLYSYWTETPLWQKAVACLAFLSPAIVSYGTWWVPPILLLGLFVQTQCFPGVKLSWRDGRAAIVPVNPREPY